MSFDPGLATSGVPHTRGPYGAGRSDYGKSLSTIAAKIRESRLDPHVSGWARQALHGAGIDNRAGAAPIRQQVQVILDAYRKQTVYTPDAVGAEVIQGASATLCLRPGLCLKGGDCDDGVVAVGSALMSVGIPAQVVMELYPPPAQGHVLLYARDEDGEWFPADPSTKDPVGVSYAPSGTQRTWVDPMSNAPIEIVGIGRHGYGVGDAPPGPALPIIPGVWTPIPSQAVRAGLRYAVGIVGPGSWTVDDAKMYFEGIPTFAATRGLFDVETLAPGPVSGAFTGWIMVGIARVDAVLANTSQVSIAGVFQETPQAGAAPPQPQPETQPQTPPTPPSPGPSLGAVLLVALGIASVGGVGYGMYRRQQRRKRLTG